MSSQYVLFSDVVNCVLKDGEYYFSPIEIIDILEISMYPSFIWLELKDKFKKKNMKLTLKREYILAKNKKEYKREVANVDELKFILSHLKSRNADLLHLCLNSITEKNYDEINNAFETYFENQIISKTKVFSGVLNVSKDENNDLWKYEFLQDDEIESISDKNILKLKRKVENRNLPWVIKSEKAYEDILTAEIENDEDFCVLDEIF